jgi:hypothetical protein
VNDEPNTRAIVFKGFFERWPGVSGIRADRVKECFDQDGVQITLAILVHEPIVPRRWQILGFYGQYRQFNDR